MIVLRADAGSRVGFGHLMRCVALAEGLRARGGEAVVLMTENPVTEDGLDAMRRGVPVERLDRGDSLAEDARATIAAARRLHAAGIVTDVCTQPALARPRELDEFHRRLREQIGFVAVFAAGDHLDPTADLVVNPYLLNTTRRTDTSDSGSRILSGPRYFVFRPEFTRAAGVPRIIPARARRIVVTVGGSDPARLTVRIIDAVAVEGNDDLEVRIVVGPGFAADDRECIAARVGERGREWAVIGPPRDMASLFLWADLAVTGDGLTKYETAVTGTPSIIVARPDSDMRLNEQFASGGSTTCVGPGADGEYRDLPRVIRGLLEDRGAREEMSRRGRELTDGRGLERVLERLPMVNVG